MFSFRTTPIEEQLDKSLTEGNVGCFCTQNSWDSDKGLYICLLYTSDAADEL